MGRINIDAYLALRFHIVKRNCWHLVRAAWLELTGLDLGDLTPARITAEALCGAVGASEPRFKMLDQVSDPCIVLMHRPGATPHVGLYYRGRVLQMTPKGASYMPLDIACFGYLKDEVRFYYP